VSSANAAVEMAGVELFRGLTDQQLEHLERVAYHGEYDPGAVVVHERQAGAMGRQPLRPTCLRWHVHDARIDGRVGKSACAIQLALARERWGLLQQLPARMALPIRVAEFHGRADDAAAAYQRTRPRSPPGVVIRFLPQMRAGCNGRREVSER
jgi:hypothetical protein